MGTFLLGTLLYGGIFLAFTLPIAILAPRHGNTETPRRFLIAAGVLTLLSASIVTTREQLVSQCEAVGNTACWDYGGTGLLLLLVGPYAVVALIRAFYLYRD